MEDLKNEISTKEKILEEKKIKALEELNEQSSKDESEKENMQIKEERLYALESQRNHLQNKVKQLEDHTVQ